MDQSNKDPIKDIFMKSDSNTVPSLLPVNNNYNRRHHDYSTINVSSALFTSSTPGKLSENVYKNDMNLMTETSQINYRFKKIQDKLLDSAIVPHSTDSIVSHNKKKHHSLKLTDTQKGGHSTHQSSTHDLPKDFCAKSSSHSLSSSRSSPSSSYSSSSSASSPTNTSDTSNLKQIHKQKHKK